MGITTSSKTIRETVKSATSCSRDLIAKTVNHEESSFDVHNFLETIKGDSYVFIGKNNMPHRFMTNSKSLSFMIQNKIIKLHDNNGDPHNKKLLIYIHLSVALQIVIH